MDDTRTAADERRKCQCRSQCKCRVLGMDASPGGTLVATGSTNAFFRVRWPPTR